MPHLLNCRGQVVGLVKHLPAKSPGRQIAAHYNALRDIFGADITSPLSRFLYELRFASAKSPDKPSRPHPASLKKRGLFHSFTRLSLSAFIITDTELKLIAAAAMTGESSNPKNGYSTPAATGMPITL